MRRLWLACLLSVLCMSSSFAWTIHSGHPRYIIRAEDVAGIRARVLGPPELPWYTRWKTAVRAKYPAGQWSNGYLDDVAALCLMEVVQSDIDALNEKVAALTEATGYISGAPGSGRDDAPSVAYDWGYDYLSTANRTLLQNRALNRVGSLTPATTEVWFKIDLWGVPFIFYGDGDASYNSTMLTKAQLWVTDWENAQACYAQVYGAKSGFTYYSMYANRSVLYELTMKRMLDGYTGGGTGTDYLLHLPYYWSHMKRPDDVLLRTIGRFNSADMGAENFGAMVLYNAPTLTWWRDWIQYRLDTNYQSDSGAPMNNTVSVLLYDPSIPSAQVPIARTYWNEAIGQGFWRSGWHVSPSSLDQQVFWVCGPATDEDQRRWAGHFFIRRGADDLIMPSGKWITDTDQGNKYYTSATTGSNGILILNPAEDLGGGIPNDGGQTLRDRVNCALYWPACAGDCTGQAGWGPTSDSLVTDAALEFGGIGNMDAVYATAKASKVRRSIRVPQEGWVLVQDYVELVGTRDTRVVFHTIRKPTTDGTETQVEGNTYGGIYSYTGSSYFKVTEGVSGCVVYPAYTNQTRSMRLVGGQNPSDLALRQYVTTGIFTYDATTSNQGYECWMVDRNRPATHSNITTTWVADRNCRVCPTAGQKCGDWRIEWFWDDATSTLRNITLFEVMGSGLSPRAVTATVNGNGVDIFLDGVASVVIHEPFLTDQGYTNQDTDLSFTNTGTGDYFGYGFAPGTYDVRLGGVFQFAVSAPNGNITFPIPSIGTWRVIQSGTPPVVGACCNDGNCTITEEVNCVGTWQGVGTNCDPNLCSAAERACCKDGFCALNTLAGCTTAGGVWMEFETACDPNPCPVNDTGPCCFADGSCLMLTKAGCAAAGGVWTPGFLEIPCDPNPCTQPSGACCYVDGTCADLTEALCSGAWQGGGTDCDPNPCTQPVYACCFTDGSCQMLTVPNCEFLGGTTLDGISACIPQPCPQPSGACCYSVGFCALTTHANCPGTWTFDGSCTPNPCPQGIPGGSAHGTRTSPRPRDFIRP